MENPIRTHDVQHHSSSRFTNNLAFFISSIIIFIFIVGAIITVSYMLKLEIDSQSLSSNPSKAIRDVCREFHNFDFYIDFFGSWMKEQELKPKLASQKLCFDSISSLHNQNYTNKINPSMIFRLSLQLSLNKIKNLDNEPAMEEICKKLLDHSKSQLNLSLTLVGLDPSDSILKNEKMVHDMKSWIKNALGDVNACLVVVNEKRFVRIIGLDEFAFKINMAKASLGYCSGILDNLGKIFGLFYPSIGSALGIDFFYSNIDIFSSIVFFCSQYVMLIIIVGVFLHVWRRN